MYSRTKAFLSNGLKSHAFNFVFKTAVTLLLSAKRPEAGQLISSYMTGATITASVRLWSIIKTANSITSRRRLCLYSC